MYYFPNTNCYYSTNKNLRHAIDGIVGLMKTFCNNPLRWILWIDYCYRGIKKENYIVKEVLLLIIQCESLHFLTTCEFKEVPVNFVNKGR